jgi:hypothetical protein
VSAVAAYRLLYNARKFTTVRLCLGIDEDEEEEGKGKVYRYRSLVFAPNEDVLVGIVA